MKSEYEILSYRILKEWGDINGPKPTIKEIIQYGQEAYENGDKKIAHLCMKWLDSYRRLSKKTY